jgi:hypothetical protein
MPSPSAEATQHARAAATPAASARHISTINPLTGLSTDYLNHFTEVVMVLELGTVVPECLEDLRSWRPKTYREHFAQSRFHDRGAIIAAYEGTDPVLRDALDNTAKTLNAVLLESRDTVLAHLGTPDAEALSQRAAAWIKPLIARIAGIINGVRMSSTQPVQATVDALFAR